jgi:hypothetical protein
VGITVERNLGQINAAAQRTQASFSVLRGVVGQMAAAFGVTFGAGTLAQLGRMAVDASAVATAYRRQQVAALELAGSQTKLNQLLDAYQRATGGAIDRATALADVTRLQAIGFADTAAELERFVRAARGISIATGQQQDYVISQLQLAIANQSTLRLDQLGLGVAEVKKRVAELKAENRGLTTEMAYQNAVLGLAEQKFGALTRAAEGQATGVEQAGRAWADARLKLGELVSFPVNVAGQVITDWLDMQIRMTNAWVSALQAVGRAIGALPAAVSPTLGSRTSLGLAQREGIPTLQRAAMPAEQTAAIREWAVSVRQIERDAANQRLDATRQYEQQRSETIAQYELGIARDAADFARQRARAVADLERGIVDVLRDSAEQRAEWEADLGERISDARADANERLADLETKYNRDRERASRTHRENLFSAAARLDAAAVVQEQRRFAEESRNAKEGYDEQRGNLQDQLADRIAQEQEAHAEQLADAKRADERRIEDMRSAFEEQKQLEDEDRAIQLQRQAEDHARQLAQQDAAQAERLAQINRQAAQERQAIDESFTQQLNDLGIYYDGWQAIQDAAQARSLKAFDEWWEELGKRFEPAGPPTGPGAPRFPTLLNPPAFASGGPVNRTGTVLAHAGEFILNPTTTQMLRDAMGGFSQSGLIAMARGGGTTSNRNITVAEGAVQVFGAPGQSEERLGMIVRAEMIAALQAAA